MKAGSFSLASRTNVREPGLGLPIVGANLETLFTPAGEDTMRKLLLTVLVVAAVGVETSSAHANWFCGDDAVMRAQWAPFYPPEPAFLPQSFTCYKPEWREEKREVIVQRWQCRQVVEKVKEFVMVTKWEEQRHMQSFYTPVVKDVERDVTRCRTIPVWTFDPCNCCPVLTIKVETFVERVKTQVCEYRLDSREVVGKVCRTVPEERVFERLRTEWFTMPEKVEVVNRYCVMVPYTQQVCIPVLLPHYGPPVCPWGQ